MLTVSFAVVPHVRSVDLHGRRFTSARDVTRVRKRFRVLIIETPLTL